MGGRYVGDTRVMCEWRAGSCVMDEESLVGDDESEEEGKSQIHFALYPNTAPQQLHSNQTVETIPSMEIAPPTKKDPEISPG